MKYQAIFITLIAAAAAASTNINSTSVSPSTNNGNQAITSIIANAKSIAAQKAQNNLIPAAFNSNQTPEIVISNVVVASNTPLGKYSGQFNIKTNQYQCIEGAMYCDYYGYGFWTCAEGTWVYRNCGPGTTCIENNGSLYCGYPQS